MNVLEAIGLSIGMTVAITALILLLLEVVWYWIGQMADDQS